jgi:hypothetical protein
VVRVVVPVLVARPSDPTSAAPAAPGPEPALATLVVPETPAPLPPRGLGSQRIAALGVAGLGVVGLGIGAVLGLKAISTLDESDRLCDGQRCTQRGADLASRSRDEADGSTLAFLLGGAAVAAGVILWLTAPSRGAAAARTISVGIAPSRSGAATVLGGTFD